VNRKSDIPESDDQAANPAGEEPLMQAETTPIFASQPIETEEALLAAQMAELKDKLLRAMAETENLRRRHARERVEAEQYAATAFARDMLSVADNLRRALDAASQLLKETVGDAGPIENVIAGIEVTERELMAAFERHDIKRIEPMGEKFDPHFHQAMFEIEDASQPPGTIVRVMAAGYSIAGRLLRPAMVGVAKAPSANRGSDQDPGHRVNTVV
jgi:molecular chaperone GrpE